MNTALNHLNHSPFFECLHKCIILGQNRVFLMLENCSNYWFCVHQKMCHAIITSIIGLNFFHFSSLTSKLTWIFRKIDMKPIVVWRHFFSIMSNFQCLKDSQTASFFLFGDLIRIKLKWNVVWSMYKSKNV